MYKIIEKGQPNAFDHRLFIEDEYGPISLIHDIPLCADSNQKTFNMIVEKPRWTNAEMEVSMYELLNPIKQNIKHGKLHYVSNCFPHHGYIWNYGILPQTWSNPLHIDNPTGFYGNNKPIDILEIGYKVAKTGQVLEVKILGILAVIDEGKCNWKLISIDNQDPLASQLEDISDIENHFPGLLKATIEWFRIFKIPEGQSETQLAFNGEIKPVDFAYNVIAEQHGFWMNLMNKDIEVNDVSCVNVRHEESSFKIKKEEALEIVKKSCSCVQPDCLNPPLSLLIDKWHYINLL